MMVFAATTAAFPDGVMAFGVILAATMAAAALLAPSERGRALAVLSALVLTPVLLVAEIWDTPQLESIRDRTGLAALAAVGGLLAVAGLGAVLARRPGWLPLLAVAAVPFRIPVEAGGATANLLVPLYGVIGAGALAYAVPRLRQDRPVARPARRLERILAAALVLYAVQAAYSSDLAKALEQVVFFYAPFALLFLLLRETHWDRALVLRCLGVLVGLALLFVAVGFWEYANRELLLNPKVIVSNEIESYFRVNSLFFDPNIYGRFLAMVMLGLATLLLWARAQRTLLLTIGALAVLWAGLVLTLSQSSLAALLAGLVVLAAVRFDVRRTLTVATAVFVVAGGGVLLFPSALKVDLGDTSSLNEASSGRLDLMEGGINLFGDRPLQGWGAGAFEHEFRRHEKASSQRATSASHTIPITVAAEQGVAGVVLYLLLLGAALWRLLRGVRGDPARAAIAACFVALLVHTMLYAAFLEDPLAWVLLAAGTALMLGPLPSWTRPGHVERNGAGPSPDGDAADALASLRAPAPSP